jgi:hypothetical protein
MATRANVLIKSKDSFYPLILLYHHLDGYPKFMLPTMLKYEKILNEELKKFGGGEEWKKVLLEDPTALAALIVATDPTGFRIEDVFRREEEVVLNGDIEYCYVITTGPEGVFIEIYVPDDLSDESKDIFWLTGDPKLLRQILPSTPFTEEEVKKILKMLG